MANIEMRDQNTPSRNGERWIESIMLELNAEKQVVGIYNHPSSQIETQGIRQALVSREVTIPESLATKFFYEDTAGMKHVKRVDFVLLPIQVFVQQR